jgi:nucleotidyltransferase/DNA polymerase involved in DNA repair
MIVSFPYVPQFYQGLIRYYAVMDTPIAKQTKPAALNSSIVKESVYGTDNILTSPVPGAAPGLPSSQFYTQDLIDAQLDAQLQPRRLSEVSIRESMHSTPSPPSSPVPTKSRFPSFQNSSRAHHNDSIAHQLLAEEDIEPSSAQKQLDIEYEDIEPSSAQKQPDTDHEEIEDEDIEDSPQVTPRPRQLQSSPAPERSIQMTPFQFSPAPKTPGAGISSDALDADWLDESFQEDAQLIKTPYVPAASRFVERKRQSPNIPSPILESEAFDDDAQLINTPYITAASRFMERKRPSPILESPIQTVKKVKYGHPNPEDLIDEPTGAGDENFDLDEDAGLFEDDFVPHSAQPQVHSSNPRESSTPPRRFDTHSSTPSKEPTPDILESPVVSYPEAAQVRMRNARTPEEFNQALLTLPAARDRCCLNPNFLTHFFTSSRLHHLSTWKLYLRQSVAAALASHPSQRNLRPRKTRYILHIDFDSFFCSVSLLSHPELKGKPVAVCHGSSKHSTTSEIASCNYVAREKGVKNGMWLEQARKLCPSLVTLPYDFEAYKEASRVFYDVVLGVGPERIQAVSVDEVLVDCSNLICDNYSATAVREAKVMELAEKIRNEVREKTRCEVSVGVGTNVLLARVALRKAKPAGQAMVTEVSSREVMGMLDVRDLPGIGRKIAEGFSQRWKSSTVADIRRISKEELQRQLGGKTGQRVYDMCRGIDTTEVGEAEVARESLSVAVNWGVRFYKKEQFVDFLSRLAEYVEEKLRLEGLKGHKLTFSIAKRGEGQPFETTKFLGCGKCDMISKTEKFVESTNSAKAIAKACLGIYNRLTIQVGDIRGLTIQMTELEEDTGKSKQQTLQFQRVPKSEKISPNPKNQTNTPPSAQPQKTLPKSASNQRMSPQPAAPSRKGKEKATSYTPSNPSSPAVSHHDEYPINSPNGHTRQWPLKHSSSGSPQNRLDNIDFSNPAVKEFLVSPTTTNRYTHPSNFRSPGKGGTSENKIGTPSKGQLFAAFQKTPPKRTAADPVEDDEDPFVPFTPNQIPSSAQPIFGTPISPRTRASLLAAAATQVPFEPPAEANPPSIIPRFHDAAGRDITDWLFLPLSEGGAGLDKEIFLLHTKSEQEHEVKKLLKGKKEAEERAAAAAREAERAVATRQNIDRVREGDARNWRRKGELWLSIGRPVKKEHMHSVNMAVARWAKEVEQPITREDREEVMEFLKGLVEEEEMDKAGVFLRFLKGLARDMPEWRWLAEVCERTVREAARKRLGWENVVF